MSSILLTKNRGEGGGGGALYKVEMFPEDSAELLDVGSSFGSPISNQPSDFTQLAIWDGDGHVSGVELQS